MGGDIAMGALTGALSGACGGFGYGGWGNVGHIIGSAVGGALSSEISGGNPLMGALTAAVTSDILAHGFGLPTVQYPELGDMLSKEFLEELAITTTVNSLVGGTAAEIQGGNFLEGAKDSALSSASGTVISTALNVYVQDWFEDSYRNRDTDIEVKMKNIDFFAEDTMGHWFIEMGWPDRSYGWWPKESVSYTDAIVGVPGELNAKYFGGTQTTDPHHGDTSSEGFKVYKVKLANQGRIEYGIFKGIHARYASEFMVKNALIEYARAWKGTWRFPGRACHTFTRRGLRECGLVLSK